MKTTQLFALMGFIIGWGAPVGAMGLQFFLQNSTVPLNEFVDKEWARNAFFYWYMLIGTCLVLTVVGWLLGRHQEQIEKEFTEKEKRAKSTFR
ncbi:MAG TPA: hypothetical protein VIJ93_07375 [bacterium]